jgi:hypothetical protein
MTSIKIQAALMLAFGSATLAAQSSAPPTTPATVVAAAGSKLVPPPAPPKPPVGVAIVPNSRRTPTPAAVPPKPIGAAPASSVHPDSLKKKTAAMPALTPASRFAAPPRPGTVNVVDPALTLVPAKPKPLAAPVAAPDPKPQPQKKP